jgi:gluconolactonase
MDVIVYSPHFERILDTRAEMRQIATGFQFTEGPVWDSARERLLFSDIPANRQYQWREDTGAALYREPTGNSNGLTFDNAGNLLNCEHSGRRVSRLDLGDGSLVPLATRYDGKRLNSPNDIVGHSNGSIYFTDPPYGVQPEQRELDFQGVYRLDTDGTLTLLAADFERPNGIALSPDEKTLYVDDTPRHHVRAFDVRPDGGVENGRVFGTTDPSVGDGRPDGLKVDVEGNLYVTGPGGVWVFGRDGKALGVIRCPEVPANLAWGDADKKTLYITARTSVYRVRTNIAGLRRF